MFLHSGGLGSDPLFFSLFIKVHSLHSGIMGTTIPIYMYDTSENQIDISNPDDLFRSLFNMLPDPFFVVGEDGTYLEVLGGTERTLYDDGVPLKGKNIYEFMPHTFADMFMTQIRRTMEMGSLNTFDYKLETSTITLTTKNGPGGQHWFEARMYPLEKKYKGQRAVSVMLINITERRNLYKQLQKLSYQDPLTGLYNRRYFMQRVGLHLTQNSKAHILICDIDNFKNINDTWGHLAGDKVLREFSRRAKVVLQNSDAIARIGGDEFVIALTDKSDREALEIAERLRIRIAEEPFYYQDIAIQVHVSIGVAPVKVGARSAKELIGEADRALYQAKAAGRNRVSLRSELS